MLAIGAGIAGASAAHELAARRRVLLQREDNPGYHTAGRSAAMYIETYGNATMRALATGSRAFFMAPPAGFASSPLLAPRGALTVATADQVPALERSYAECRAPIGNLERWSGAQVRARVPCFAEAQVAAAIGEPDAMDIARSHCTRATCAGCAAAAGGSSVAPRCRRSRTTARAGAWPRARASLPRRSWSTPPARESMRAEMAGLPLTGLYSAK
ncbi:MAG: FAD-dependent oxidoreductase [Betaproteobacteria bacterium]